MFKMIPVRMDYCVTSNGLNFFLEKCIKLLAALKYK